MQWDRTRNNTATILSQISTTVFIEDTLHQKYLKVVASCASVCPSREVTGGHRKRFDPETQGTVSMVVE